MTESKHSAAALEYGKRMRYELTWGETEAFKAGAESRDEEISTLQKNMANKSLEQQWDLVNALRKALEQAEALEAENAKLREALEFYAEGKNWYYVTLNRDLNDCGVISAYRDEGSIARKALGEK